MFENSRGKKLLIIGSETNIMNIVKEAKAMGVYTIVTERGTEYSKQPAKIIADESWDIDYSNTELLAKKCFENGVDGVFTGYSDGKLYYATKLSEVIDKPFYVTSEQVELTRNKRLFKKLCSNYGILTPFEYSLTGKISEQEKSRIKFPVIVKPADYGGRIGISICNCREELDNALALAEKNSETHTVVVEEYLEGAEITAIYTIVDGEISLSIINDKYLSKEGKQYACLCDVAITPSRFYKLYVDTVDTQIKNLLLGIGIKNGIAGFQFIVTGNKIAAFEMTLRLNGGNDWKLLSACNDINHMRMLINYSLTGSMGDSLTKDNPHFKELMATYVMYAHSGEVGNINYSGILEHDGVIDVSPYAYVGKHIIDRGTTQQRVISFKIRTKTLDKMADIIHFIQDHVKVNDVNGRNLMFKNFDTSRFNEL